MELRLFILSLLVYLSLPVLGQNPLPPKPPSDFNVYQIHSGHSLTDPLFHPHWPGQYVNLMTEVLGTWAFDYVGKSTIPGSTLKWRWENPTDPDARHDIGDWELLSITERVPVCYEGGGTQQWYLDCIDEQREYLSMFVNNAWENGNNGDGAPTLLWTTWTNIDDSDGPWRAMLDIQEVEWENMQNYANDNLPEDAIPVYIIPGHRMMARLYDDIALGLVPDVDDISDFFSDNIHTNELGAYAIAMIHYACIFNTSPVGLPNDLLPNAGPDVPIPSPALADYLQHMIWDVVTSYDPTGIYIFLSADLASFSVVQNSKFVDIIFELVETEDLDWVDIQHSINGRQFETFERISSDRESSVLDVKATHYQPIAGINYYRLKMADNNGDFTYSPIKSVRFPDTEWKVYPNPSNNFITLENQGRVPSMIVLRDSRGRTVSSAYQTNRVEVMDLKPGVYIANIVDGNNHSFTKVIIY